MYKLPSLLKTFFRAMRGQIPYGESSDDIRELQKAIQALGGDPGPVDGIYGLMTEGGLEEIFPTTVKAPVPVDFDSSEVDDARIVRFDQPGGLDLRSTRHGGPVPPRSNGRDRYIVDRGVDPKVLVIHWTAGPATAQSLRDLFGRGDRAVSTHYGIDTTGIYQYLPDKVWAYHAGWINQVSIGIDICQPVLASRLDDAVEAGYETGIVLNPPPKRGGYSNVLSLDPRVAESTRELVFHLCEKHGIPLEVPRTSDGSVDHGVVFDSKDELNGFSGVVGHHHCAASKWDIAPWWQAIFAGTSLGD